MVDAIVVGSGPAGAQAAAALVDAGRTVTMLDVGTADAGYGELVPPLPFSELRRTDPGQHRYFLGDQFEGIPFGAVGVGAQLTPPRLYMVREVEQLAPIRSATFTAMQSFALGGLGAGWGAVASPYGDEELRHFPVSRAELAPHYDEVARRIGVTGADDDLSASLEDPPSALPPLDLDSNAAAILASYEARREALNARGLVMGRARLAVCSRELGGRGPHAYRDMDFWADADQSVYRPRFTVAALRERPNFRYVARRLVTTFAEDADGVEAVARDVDSGEVEHVRARALVLAAGALGTARIVLRSRRRYDTAVPLLSNPYVYAPTVNLGMLGRAGADRRHGLAQLLALSRATDDRERLMTVQVYSYRSLLTFRLLKETPLPYREGLRAMRILVPALAILGLHHADAPSADKYCILRRGDSAGGSEILEVHYALSKEETRAQRSHERQVVRAFRRLGCWSLGIVRPPHGASIRYAGTIPMRVAGDDLTCEPSCRLRGSRAVYVADGSVFPYLPAKGLTFTMMANANRVGAAVADALG